nr:hypothetical protein [Tanacetum cinerariifolium]
GKLDFDDVYFVKELKFNLFSVSQMRDKKNNVLFTDTECLVLSFDFKLPDESQVLLRVPKENNMYNVNLKNIIPSGDLTCLFAKATLDESNLWHRRLGHVNFKTINKLVKGNLVRGLPSKVFINENSCVACKKGKQHRASCMSKTVFFLPTKDETAFVLKTFIVGLENLLSLKVKIIRCDNGTEFKNADLYQFCGIKGIKREFSVPRNPKQNGIAERKNMTLIEAARTMLADSLLLIPFWAEAVNTACYVQIREQGDKAENKDKGKSPVVTITGFKDLNEKFAECINNSSNGVNAAGSSVSAVGLNFTNSTNDFSAAGPSNAAMPNLEDLSHNADDVGAEADINNMESIISTRIMARGVRDQGGISQMFNEDFHTCMFACFLSQEEPKRVHQALKDPSWIESMQEELFQFKMQKV